MSIFSKDRFIGKGSTTRYSDLDNLTQRAITSFGKIVGLACSVDCSEDMHREWEFTNKAVLNCREPIYTEEIQIQNDIAENKIVPVGKYRKLFNQEAKDRFDEMNEITSESRSKIAFAKTEKFVSDYLQSTGQSRQEILELEALGTPDSYKLQVLAVANIIITKAGLEDEEHKE